MDAFLIVAGTALVTAWFARLLHRRTLRRRLAEYGRGHARLRELEADLRIAETRHEVALERMRRERDALADACRTAGTDTARAASAEPVIDRRTPMLVLDEEHVAGA